MEDALLTEALNDMRFFLLFLTTDISIESQNLCSIQA